MGSTLIMNDIDLYTPCSGTDWRNPYGMYARLRRDAPVYRVPDNGEGEDYFVLSRYQDVFDASMDGEIFTSTEGLTPSYNDKLLHEGRETPIVMMDGPEHVELRHIALQSFKPNKLRALEPVLRQFVIDQIDKLVSDGEGNFITKVAKPLPSLFVSLALGVPLEDRVLFDKWAWAIASASATGNVMAASENLMELVQYFSALMAKRMADPKDDMISTLVHAELKGGGKLSPEKILGVGFTMVLGGNDTATGLMGAAAEYMTRWPDQRQTLKDDSGHIKNAIEEFLRLSSPVQGLSRTVTEDVNLHGVTIPKGRKVHLLYASANRDEAMYGDTADVCDVTRQLTRHVAFSSGPHMCIGAAGARMQAKIVIEELLARCPDFTVDFEKAEFAEGHFVRRYDSLPFQAN